MAGIYIHIPFCKQACHYCDFHFSTKLNYIPKLIDCIVQEIELRHTNFKDEIIHSIYVGGGTPSIIDPNELSKIFEKLNQRFNISNTAEITLEANPDDISHQLCLDWKKIGINRLSLGVQSFFNEDLKWMNRAHEGTEIYTSIPAVQSHFDNWSLDLIYGSTPTTMDRWASNLEVAIGFDPPHISCYGLTIEENTALDHFIKTGKVEAPSDITAAHQFSLTHQFLTENNYEHYEISNYALAGKKAIHNSNYWNDISYIGFGPSAHSYYDQTRFWNVSDNAKYIDALENDELIFGSEKLTLTDQFNEYIMTKLRTSSGINLSLIQEKFKLDFKSIFSKSIEKLLEEEKIIEDKTKLRVSPKGMLYADAIASEWFLDNDLSK